MEAPMILKPQRLFPILFLGLALSSASYDANRTITTSISDAYPVASWINEYAGSLRPTPTSTFDLTPGYYRVTIQSYCLHAGTYAPTRGSGYLLAPLKGEKAGLVQSILRLSVDHPEISQEDIQRLIWGIESGAKFRDYPADFQARVSPLLDPGEIARGSAEDTLHSTLDRYTPQGLRHAMDFYGDLRRRLTDGQTSFHQLEELAVRTGIAPEGPGSLRVEPGGWGYAGNNFYMRTYPETYPTTTIEILLPACYRLQRDRLGRIQSFQSGDFRIDVRYDEMRSDSQVSRFNLVRFSDPSGSFVISNAGWIVSSDVAAFQDGRNWERNNVGAASAIMPAGAKGFIAPGAAEFQTRIADARRKWSEIGRYQSQWRRPRGAGSTEAEDITDITHFAAGIAALKPVAESQGNGSLYQRDVARLMSAWVYSGCLASGDCSRTGWGRDCDRTLDPSGLVAAPGNTDQQRLGMSARIKNPQQKIP